MVEHEYKGALSPEQMAGIKAAVPLHAGDPEREPILLDAALQAYAKAVRTELERTLGLPKSRSDRVFEVAAPLFVKIHDGWGPWDDIDDTQRATAVDSALNAAESFVAAWEQRQQEEKP